MPYPARSLPVVVALLSLSAIVPEALAQFPVRGGGQGQQDLQVVATFDGELNLKDYKDEYREGLRKIIDAKIAGEEIVATEVQDPPKVVDLMEALRRSLNAVSTEKKKPAKAEIKKAKAKATALGDARSAKAANGARKRKAG